MAKKKQGKNVRTAAEKELKATVKKLKSRLDRAETKADSWKDKAKKHRAASALSSAEVKKLEKRLKKAMTREVVVVEAAQPVEPQIEVVVEPDSSPVSIPDSSWTVAELRAEARARGLAGFSRKSKAELLATLA